MQGFASSVENFEEWVYNPNLDIEEEVYLVALLAAWLSDQAFEDSSTSVCVGDLLGGYRDG